MLHQYLLGSVKGEICDHRDGNGLNNTRSNIRITTQSVNVVRAKPRRNKLGYRGICQRGPGHGYRVQVGYNNKCIKLGTFKTLEEAVEVRDETMTRLFGGEAPKSKIDGWIPPPRIRLEWRHRPSKEGTGE